MRTLSIYSLEFAQELYARLCFDPSPQPDPVYSTHRGPEGFFCENHDEISRWHENRRLEILDAVHDISRQFTLDAQSI